jgi:hypothetical protein
MEFVLLCYFVQQPLALCAGSLWRDFLKGFVFRSLFVVLQAEIAVPFDIPSYVP